MTIDPEAAPNLWNDERMVFLKAVESDSISWPVGFRTETGIIAITLADEARINSTDERNSLYARELGHKGTWSIDGVYSIGDTVYHGGVLFVLTDVATKHAPTERCCQWVPVLVWNMPAVHVDQWAPGAVERCCMWTPIESGIGLEKVHKRWPLAFERYEIVRIERRLFMCMRETCLVHHSVPRFWNPAAWMFLRKTSVAVALYLEFDEPEDLYKIDRLIMMDFVTESIISDIHMAVLNTVDINHADGSELQSRRMDHFGDVFSDDLM